MLRLTTTTAATSVGSTTAAAVAAAAARVRCLSSASGGPRVGAVVGPSEEHTSTLIWLHGLGDSSAGFAPLFSAGHLFPDSGLPLHTKVVLPDAPHIPITINGGAVMPGWYDITELGREDGGPVGPFDPPAGLEASADYVASLISTEAEAFDGDTSRVVVGGFSQGGALATYTALKSPTSPPLAGLVAWSSYVLDTESVSDAAAGLASPMLVHHGTADPMVPLPWAKPGWEALADALPGTDQMTYQEWTGVGHDVCIEQVSALDAWLAATVGLPNKAP